MGCAGAIGGARLGLGAVVQRDGQAVTDQLLPAGVAGVQVSTGGQEPLAGRSICRVPDLAAVLEQKVGAWAFLRGYRSLGESGQCPVLPVTEDGHVADEEGQLIEGCICPALLYDRAEWNDA